MFEYPEAKRVRRAELFGSETASVDGGVDDARDDELRAALEAQIAKSLGFTEPSENLRRATPAQCPARDTADVGSDTDSEMEEAPPPAPASEDGEEEGYVFRLFSTSTDAPKVVLEKEDEELKGDGGFVEPLRPMSYYWVKDVSPRKKQEYEFAAVSGDDVLARSTKRHYGLELPWKVTSITVSSKSRGTDNATDAEADKGLRTKRKRPGKKRRITLRTRERTKKAKEEAAAKQSLEKEEHIKEKKKRLNRLKKMRKRAKAREKKAGAGEGGEDGPSDGEGSGSE